MGLFVCDYCHVIENTACGFWHSRRNSERMLGLEYKNGTALCSGCTPAKWADGSDTKFGKWHNIFARNIANPEWIQYQKETCCIYVDSQGALDVLNGTPPKSLQCWSCHEVITFAERSNNDGDCICCGVEIELEE